MLEQKGILPLEGTVGGETFVSLLQSTTDKRMASRLGYTIMPNHMHGVIAFSNCGKKINTIVGNGKRFMAYEIVNRLKEMNVVNVLERLTNAVDECDRLRGKHHEVWEDSFDWKECYNEEIILQKLDYIHNNPCKGKNPLAKDPCDFAHSSAKFYLTGEQGIYPVTHYLKLNDIDLAKQDMHCNMRSGKRRVPPR